MIAADLLPPPPQSLPRNTAARLLAACVADYEVLKTFDNQTLTFDEDPARIARTRELRAAWGQWADAAQEVHDRLKDDPSLNDLERQKFKARIGHARHMIGVDVTEMRRRYERTLAGEYITREEARRALGLPHRR